MTVETQLVDQKGKEYRAHFVAKAELAVSGSPIAGPAFICSIEEQLSDWLRRRKGLDLNVRHDNDLTEDGRSVTVVHHEGGHGAQSIKATLVEDNPTGQWRTELLGSSDGWIDLRVRNAEGQFADVPNLAKYLLDVLPIGDGNLAMGAEARVVGADRVDEVLDAIFDPERRGLVFVCATSDEHDLLEPFSERVRRWTRQIYGLGQAYLLGPEATAAFNREAGVFGTLPWTIRTYYPAPDRDDLQDSRRHRYLTTASLARLRDRQISELLGTIARAHASSRPEPKEVTRLRRDFDRLSAERLSDVVHIRAGGDETEVDQPDIEQQSTALPVETDTAERMPVVDDAGAAVIQLVKEVLQVGEVTRDSLLGRLRQEREAAPVEALAEMTKRLNQQQARIWGLEDQSRAAEELLEGAELDEAELRERIDSMERQHQWLRDRLREKDDHEAAYAQAETMVGLPESSRPKTLLEVVEKLSEGTLPGLVFTGDLAVVADVQSRDTMGNAAQAAWEACCALSDYVRVVGDGTFEGAMEHYLKNLPDGCRGVPTKKHATGESVQTMNQYGKDRIFPVPTSVDPDGKATMEAHFKLASIGMVSPRLYYLDKVRQEGTIYIGYIGKHLRNTQTN